MTVEEIFSNLSSHMVKGLMVHDQIAHAFGFLNLQGYQKCHEYHYFEESKNYQKLNNLYLRYYHKLIMENNTDRPQIIPQNWYKYTKSDVDAGTRKNAIRDLLKKWIDWEKETNELLASCYKELCEQGHIFGAMKIKEFLLDVGEELAGAQEKLIALEAMNYDMAQIVAEQEQLYEMYKNKLHEDDSND